MQKISIRKLNFTKSGSHYFRKSKRFTKKGLYIVEGDLADFSLYEVSGWQIHFFWNSKHLVHFHELMDAIECERVIWIRDRNLRKVLKKPALK